MRRINDASIQAMLDKKGSMKADASHAYAVGYVDGARYVLDAMTSEQAIQAFAAAVEVMDDQDIDSTPLEEITTALCAVRKEIEGE